jgi:hypothetical protein
MATAAVLEVEGGAGFVLTLATELAALQGKCREGKGEPTPCRCAGCHLACFWLWPKLPTPTQLQRLNLASHTHRLHP